MTDGITTAPIMKELSVPLPPEEAFALFTTNMADWWPLDDRHSIFGEGAATVVFEGRQGGRIYEVATDGREGSWGVVDVWEPPHRVVYSWNPNPERDDSKSTEVEVRFAPHVIGCLLTLEHRAWERLGDEASVLRPSYAQGWDIVLERYLAATGA